MKTPLRIAVTTGDADGIGTEVSAKALASLGPQKGVVFYQWRSPKCPKSHLNLIDSKFKRITVASLPEALSLKTVPSNYLVDINSKLSPAHWVEITAQASVAQQIDALATGPLSKTVIADAGMKDIGHTDILKRVNKRKDVFMSFLGEKFSVVLVTGHIPVKRISKEFNQKNLEKSILAADGFRRLLPKPMASKPIAVLGLNPHAGEAGLIGKEESEIHMPVLNGLRAENKIAVIGPLVPDAAFFPTQWEKYSVYIANYHDQGLIPFKMIHGQESGVNLTLGLSFIRTSVDHGTAKDIFGKNKADASSMRLALEWAVKLAKQSRKNADSQQ